MKRLLLVLVAGITMGLLDAAAQSETVAPQTKLRVLVVYGGHEFETNQFFRIFREQPGISLATAAYPAAQALFKPAVARNYDVLVFYDMWQELSSESKSNLVTLIKGGKPLVALHHTLGAFQKWDEYAKIIGGRYHLEKWTDGGTEKPASTYKHDVDFKVHVEDPNHPVTHGIKDFAIHDETYGKIEVRPESHVLLTTDEPTASHALGWVTSYGAARVVYLQLGHDHQAYDNPNYQQLVRQAIQWVAQR